jgi:hypothetical protein
MPAASAHDITAGRQSRREASLCRRNLRLGLDALELWMFVVERPHFCAALLLIVDGSDVLSGRWKSRLSWPTKVTLSAALVPSAERITHPQESIQAHGRNHGPRRTVTRRLCLPLRLCRRLLNLFCSCIVSIASTTSCAVRIPHACDGTLAPPTRLKYSTILPPFERPSIINFLLLASSLLLPLAIPHLPRATQPCLDSTTPSHNPTRETCFLRFWHACQ